MMTMMIDKNDDVNDDDDSDNDDISFVFVRLSLHFLSSQEKW